MAGNIDLTDDPRIDMAMAQSIGNLLKSVGQAEQNRQKRYKMDQVMTGVNSGADPMQAIQSANQTDAPYGKGLAGVGQRIGGFIGGAPRDLEVGDDAIERLLANNLNKKYQLVNTEKGYGNYDSGKGTITDIPGATRPQSNKKAVDPDKEYLRLSSVVNQHKDNMTPEAFEAINNQADAAGLRLSKKEDISPGTYASTTKINEEGQRYNEGEDGSRTLIPRQYEYSLEKDPVPSREGLGIKGGTKGEQATPSKQSEQAAPSGQPVTIQDDQGVTLASLPAVPEGKTYVEIEGKYFTIPIDQIEEFKIQHPKGNVYQTGK